MLKLFNTMKRKKEPVLTKREIGIYFCGPTVYDYAHIGNFRSYIFSDLLRRYIEYLGYKVKMVMNITDVDDKTIKRSRERGMSLKEFTGMYTNAFFEDINALRIKVADVYPKATDHIKDIVNLIKKLMKKGLAYKAEDGSVYFDISKFKKYGRLSHARFKKQKSRIKHDEYTKDEAQDFALWKAWSEDDGSVGWETPLGRGRPGWHIECSVMSKKYLKTVDIHGGGVDLIFPHHENEIAQSEGAGNDFAKHWVHCEHLLVNGRKMSKSLGNFYTLRDLLNKGYDPVAIRFMLMDSHYRSQLNFTLKELDSAKKTVDNLNDFVSRLKDYMEITKAGKNKELSLLVDETKNKFRKSMDDDLNVPQALSHVFDMINVFNRKMDSNSADKESLKNAYDFMIGINKIFDFLEGKKKISAEEKQLINERERLRKNKKFKEADEIREKLKKKGIILEDTPYGIRWKKL
jgi:cysteinyl-tRNA synthetase